jgi:hypothetical protein
MKLITSTAHRMALRCTCLATLLYVLAACGGGGGGGGGTNGGPVVINISVTPTSIKLGDSATLTWSASNTSFCEARDAWTGSQALSGTLKVTPAGPGTFVYKLAGLGAISLFDAGGNFVTRLVSFDGPLNAPWGMALAPGDFGTFSACPVRPERPLYARAACPLSSRLPAC